MSCFRLTLLLSCVYVSVYCHETGPQPLTTTHRHRHARSHLGEEYDLDRLLNRLDNHLPATTKGTPTTPTKPPRYDVPVTQSNGDPGNSLWEEESPTPWGLDSERWSKILKKEELEDTEDEVEEDDVEEDWKGPTEQADSSRSWVSKYNKYQIFVNC